MLILGAGDIDRITDSIQPAELSSLMAEVFRSYSSTSSNNSTPMRTSVQTKSHNVLFMPARLEDQTSIKIVSVPTSANNTNGLPASTLVIDENTGGVKALMNARTLTALRNAGGEEFLRSLETLLVSECGVLQALYYLRSLLDHLHHPGSWVLGQELRSTIIWQSTSLSIPLSRTALSSIGRQTPALKRL